MALEVSERSFIWEHNGLVETYSKYLRLSSATDMLVCGWCRLFRKKWSMTCQVIVDSLFEDVQ